VRYGIFDAKGQIPLSRLAAETGSRHDSLCRRRAKAEKRLTRALLAGELEFPVIP
jgi:hypothetical protein